MTSEAVSGLTLTICPHSQPMSWQLLLAGSPGFYIQNSATVGVNLPQNPGCGLDKNFRNERTVVTSRSETWAEGETHPNQKGHECWECTGRGWGGLRMVADTEKGTEPTLWNEHPSLGRTPQSDSILTTMSCSVQHCLIVTIENFESIFQELLLLEINIFY